MLKLKKIAITGGVASGKSTVCQLFKELGAYVVNADAIVHELLASHTPLGQQVIRQFGTAITEKGQISRKLLAERVFKDPELLRKLEELLHPAVRQRIEEEYQKACRKGSYTSFVVEIPLLYEAGSDKHFDVTVAVLSEEHLARKRFEKAGFPETEYDLRMKRQFTPKEKANRAHFTIINNGSLDDLRKQVAELNCTLQNP